MQHLAKNEVAKRMLRQTICPNCNLRPAGSESLASSVARSCEGGCSIFLHTDALRQIAAADQGQTLARYEAAIRERVCNHLCSQPGHGDYCCKAQNFTCPLNRFMGEVIAELQSMPQVELNRASAGSNEK
jgi:hypothetical protein